jgi:hypothetical protein
MQAAQAMGLAHPIDQAERRGIDLRKVACCGLQFRVGAGGRRPGGRKRSTGARELRLTGKGEREG